MPVNTNFLSDLSEGIFGRLGELRDQQTARDESRRGEVLKLLAGLADRVEPDSLPLLMGHMGDVMKLQGPVKKFWQAFSGMPDRGFEDQLGTTLHELTNNKMIGPSAARTIRSKSSPFAAAFTPNTPEQAANRQRNMAAAEDLKGRVVFRDPRQEKVEELETRYNNQYQLAIDRLNLQNQQRIANREDVQSHQVGLKRLGESLRARRDLDAEAQKIATLNGRPNNQPDQDDYELAARNLLVRGQLSDDAVRALIDLRQSNAAKAQTEAQNVKAGKLKPTEEMAKRRFDQSQAEIARKLHGEYTGARDLYGQKSKDIESKEAEINAAASFMGGKLPKGGRLVEGDEAAKAYFTIGKGSKLIQELNNLYTERSAAESTRKSKFEQARKMPEYLKVGATDVDEIEVLPGVAASGAKRTAVRPPQATLGAPRQQGSLGPPRKRQPGEILIKIDPVKYGITKDMVLPGKDGTSKHKVTFVGKDHILAIPWK